MATFDYVAWGNANIVGKWSMATESGIYRGQCTQVVSQLLRDLGWPSYAAARGNGNQVGANMVIRGEAEYVGTNLSSIPTNEIHIICKDVGNPATAGHVSVAAVGDIVFEQNVNNDQPTHDYGIGATYSGRLGRLGESWRGTRYHYKLTIATDFDNIDGTDEGGDPTDGASGANQNRFLKGSVVDIKKSKLHTASAVKDHKKYYLVATTDRNIGQAPT